MDVDLFGSNVVTVLAMLFAAGFVYLVAAPWLQRPNKISKTGKKLKAKQPFKARAWDVGRLLVGAALLALLAQGLAVRQNPGEELPTIYFMAAPFALAVAATIWARQARKWYNVVVGVALILCGVVFGAAMLNDYYHYYPTLTDAFNLHSQQELDAQSTQPSIRYSKKDAAATGTSLEQTLPNLGTLPTQGQVYSISVPATASHFAARKGWLWAPPVAFSPQKVNLPVIVMLAGAPGNPNDWLYGGGAIKTLNNFAAQHHGIAPMVAFIDNEGSQTGDTGCVDSSLGNVETYLTVDVPAYLKANFDVASSPTGWAIGGLSDGGMCGIMLSLRHPDIYRNFFDFGGDLGPSLDTPAETLTTLFNGSQKAEDEHMPMYLLQHNSYKADPPNGYFAVGASDTSDVLDAARQLYQQSIASGLDTAYETTPDGRHTFAVWAQEFQDALPWLSYHMGATTCSAEQCN